MEPSSISASPKARTALLKPPRVGCCRCSRCRLPGLTQSIPAPVAWTGSILFNGSLSQGDTYAEAVGLNVDLLRRSKVDRIEIQGQYQFGKQKVNGVETTSTDQWDIEASYNYFMTKKLFVVGDVRVEKNRIQHLDIRVTPNAGFGYQFVETPDFNANVQGGLAWVYEDYTNIGTPDENLSLRLAYHIDKTIWTERLKAFSDCQYFPSIQNASDYLVLFDAGVRLALTKTMYSEFKAEVDYDSHPGADESSHRYADDCWRRLDVLICLEIMPRIQKILAGVGVASRRNVEQMIRDGRVALNGRIVTDLPILVDPDRDEIRVDGETVNLTSEGDGPRLYILLNKPKNVYTTNVAQGEQVRAVDLLPQNLQGRVYPVGRLEADAKGLLLFTNDGEMTHRLTHPRFGIAKTYRAIVDGFITPQSMQALSKGVWLSDGGAAAVSDQRPAAVL